MVACLAAVRLSIVLFVYHVCNGLEIAILFQRYIVINKNVRLLS